VHDLYYLHTQKSSFYEKVLGGLTVFSSKRASHIVTLSEYSRQDIISRCSVDDDRVTAIPLAAHPRFYPVLSQEAISAVKARLGIQRDYMLFVGRTEDPRKNVPALIDAYAQLKAQKRVAAQLVIAGKKSSLTEKIEQLITNLGLENDVLLPGIVSDDDLPGLLSGARVFVFVSSFEGFGLPVLEAMACGTPVITSSATSLPEVAGNAALMVSPGNVGELMEAITRVLDDEVLWNNLREQGLKRTPLFSWEHSARETLKIYEMLAL
jgi:glycosyltransferase involved in cell wall biosynthesis